MLIVTSIKLAYMTRILVNRTGLLISMIRLQGSTMVFSVLTFDRSRGTGRCLNTRPQAV